MPCENIVGVKNVLFTFYDCDNDERIGPIVHKLANDELPQWKTCPVNNERLPHGYVREQQADEMVTLTIIRDQRIPLSWYQGCVAIDVQIEYKNGIVMTGVDGGVTGDDTSDTHEVPMSITFRDVDELLPVGNLASAA